MTFRYECDYDDMIKALSKDYDVISISDKIISQAFMKFGIICINKNTTTYFHFNVVGIRSMNNSRNSTWSIEETKSEKNLESFLDYLNKSVYTLLGNVCRNN